MLTSLALIFLVGLAMAALCQMIRLPRIIGMLLTGILLGPYVLNLLDDSILLVSADLREMALVIILIKAGLSLKLQDLKAVGRPALMMSFVPASFEIVAYILFAPLVLGLTRVEAAVMGSVLAAVSPAVVVPRMVQLMEEGRGTKQHIPQMILAGASLDDVFVIVLFSTFTGMAQGGSADLSAFAGIPVSIVLGIVVGAVSGVGLAWFFETRYARSHKVRGSVQVPFSGLLAVIAMACALQMRSAEVVSRRLSEKFGKLWLAAEVILFVLVGAAVDIRYTLAAGAGALVMIFLALAVRSCGVLVCLLGTALTAKERLFCVISYLPKATVQAAIGSVPLAMGLSCGNLVLSVAVLGILITAPLGALGMDATKHRLLRAE